MSGVNPEGIPAELRNVPQWGLWRYETDASGRKTKIPYQPRQPRRKAASTRVHEWAPFDTALAALRAGHGDGIGFNFTGTPYAGLDTDHKGHADLPADVAALIRTSGSYAERTPSGQGEHIIVRGSTPKGFRLPMDHGELEVYCEGRFFTFTGDALTDPTIADGQALLDALYATWQARQGVRAPSAPLAPSAAPETDSDLWELMFRSKAGPAIRNLYYGDLGAHADHSRADLAMLGHLRFWTNGDEARMDRMFRQTHLLRAKWDELRGPLTYGQRSIQTAMSGWDGRGYTTKPATPCTTAATTDLLQEAQRNYSTHGPELLERSVNVLTRAVGHHATKSSHTLILTTLHGLLDTNLCLVDGHPALRFGGLTGLMEAANRNGRLSDLGAQLRALHHHGLIGEVRHLNPNDPKSEVYIRLPLNPSDLGGWSFRGTLILRPTTWKPVKAPKNAPSTPYKDCAKNNGVDESPLRLRAAHLTAYWMTRGVTDEATLAARTGHAIYTIRRHLAALAAHGLTGVFTLQQYRETRRLAFECSADYREMRVTRLTRSAAHAEFMARASRLLRRPTEQRTWERRRRLSLERITRIQDGESLAVVFGLTKVAA